LDDDEGGTCGYSDDGKDIRNKRDPILFILDLGICFERSTLAYFESGEAEILCSEKREEGTESDIEGKKVRIFVMMTDKFCFFPG